MWQQGLAIAASSSYTRYPEETVPEDLLWTDDAQLLCKHFSRYVMETRKANGQPYPPSTLFTMSFAPHARQESWVPQFSRPPI